MKFFHVYNEECFKGLEKNGFINKDTGFKIQHDFPMPNHLKFNEFAKKDGKLYNLIKDGSFPFYVDRIAGGTVYHKYDFDFELINEYKKMLGDWFLGFQLHESASNRLGEWDDLINKMGSKGPYNIEELYEKMMSPNATLPDGSLLPALSHDTLEYFSERTYPETPKDFFDDMMELFQRRLDDTNGNILPCDSYFMATKLQADIGINTFMPEVGCQIPQMRQQVSLTRGIANTYKKTWGTYYECWRYVEGVGYCMPCFNNDPGNEWYLSQEQHPDDFTSYGKNGGSSRLLQKRIYYYSLMSGADYMGEEWGLNCSYSDMKEFSLSEYGEVKKEFINDALELRDVKATVPFAIVLPNKYSCVMIPFLTQKYEIGNHRDTYLGRPTDAQDKAYYGHIEDVLKLCFAANESPVGNEGHVMTNSRFGDVFDVIYEDAPEEIFKSYEYLIDATNNSEFKNKNSHKKYKIIESDNLGELEHVLTKLIKETMPCYVDDLHWLVSTDSSGRRYLSVFNNEGNERDIEKGDIIHNEADKTVQICFKEATDIFVIKASCPDINIERVDEKNYKVFVPAAQFVILGY